MLPIRLAVLGSYIPNGVVAADIGCDHALLPIDLIRRDRVSKAIACDINRGPLEEAKRQVSRAGIDADRIELRLGDGLSVLKPGEASVVTIAGMGGQLMGKILASEPDITKKLMRLIVSPNNAPWRVREWASNADFEILAEEVVLDRGRFYETIVMKPSFNVMYTEAEKYFGPHLMRARDDTTKAYFSQRREADINLLTQWNKVKDEHPELHEPLMQLMHLWQEWEAVQWS